MGINRNPNRVSGLLILERVGAVSNNYQRVTAREINLQRIHNLLDQVVEGSDVDWAPTGYELTFLFSRGAFATGAGEGFQVPSYFPPLMKKHPTLKNYDDPEGKISCLAIALSYGMGKEDGSSFRAKDKKDLWIKRARDLQTQFCWESTTVVDQVQDFIDAYPQYRVVVIQPLLKNPMIFNGIQFKVNEIDLNSPNPSGVIYLYVIPGKSVGHFCYIPNIKMLIRSQYSNNYMYCHKCCEKYGRTIDHTCNPELGLKARSTKNKTLTCGYCKGKHQKSNCHLYQCKTCRQFRSGGNHRCRVISKKFKRENIQNNADQVEIFQVGGCQDGKKNALLVWDIESQLEEHDNNEEMISFVEDEQGYYTDDVIPSIKTYKNHKPIMVCVADVYGDLKQTFTGPDCIERFLAFLKQYNKGKVVAVAHNSAKYDTRLVLNYILENPTEANCNPICRGTKILQLNWDDVIFRDSFCHLPNSLKVLAKSMGLDASLQKGFFPHLFNTSENFNYVGLIPDKKYFDLPFDPNGYPEFDEWYESIKDQEWNLQSEMEKYCIQDVQVLKEIVKQFDKSTRKGVPFVISPWNYSTAPAFVHDLHVQFVNLNDEDSYQGVDTPEARKEYFEELAISKTWTTLIDEEYRFARKALRGGRTDVRRLYRKLSEQEIQDGVRIRYQDIVSMYPYQQVAQEFPVGVPTIHVFEEDAYPCIHSFYKICGCRARDEKLKIKCIETPWTEQEILANPNFFGFVCADVTAPDMFHPVLPFYNPESIKCTFPVGKITGRQVFTSVEFKKALEVGYKIDKLYRYDEYHKAPPLWAEMVKKCYLEKMRNSRNAPEGNEKEDLQAYYDEVFDMPELKFDQWEKNPVMKLVAKIMVNVGWGKHAQNMDLEHISIVGENFDDEIEELEFMNTIDENLQGKTSVGISTVGNSIMVKRKRGPNSDKRTMYNSVYLPAAIFVPAYGRLQLWEQMNLLGQRVLYHDTDSIIYEYIPGQYNIPEGEYWGQWEVDDKDKGIIEFVGLAPKSYGVRCMDQPDGTKGYEMIKFKGLSITRKHSKQINFDVMVNMIKEWQQTGEKQHKNIPQQVWTYKFGQNIVTTPTIKEFGFDETNLKGPVSKISLIQYPPGYILQE